MRVTNLARPCRRLVHGHGHSRLAPALPIGARDNRRALARRPRRAEAAIELVRIGLNVGRQAGGIQVVAIVAVVPIFIVKIGFVALRPQGANMRSAGRLVATVDHRWPLSQVGSVRTGRRFSLGRFLRLLRKPLGPLFKRFRRV